MKILKLLELEAQECRKLKKIRLKIKIREIFERIYVKYMFSEIKELKGIETILEELETEILRKRYKNEIRDLKILIVQEIELGTKETKKRRQNKRV